MDQEVRYIELKTGYSDNGPAWIARVKHSKSGKTIYFNGMALKTSKGMGIGGNYFDLETGDDYWISGVKKQEWNRHWAGGGKVMIERSVYDWYLSQINFSDTNFLEVIDDLRETDITALHKLENEPLDRSIFDKGH